MARKQRRLEVKSGNPEEHKAYASKSFSQKHIIPLELKTFPQRQFATAYDRDIPIIVQIGSAGTGKTHVALHKAISSVIDKSTVYDQLVVFRSAVQTREIGFTPGAAHEKGEPYEDPYHALFDEIMDFKSKNYENLKATNLVDFRTTSFERGTTYNNTVMVVDECQSMTFHELCTLLTRCGHNSRIIFCGDFTQDDLLKKKNDVSGLGGFLHILSEMDSSMVDIITYTPHDVVRCGIVREFLITKERLGM